MQWSPPVRVPGPVRALPAVCYAVVVLVASVVDPPAGGVAPTGPLGLVGVDKWLHAVGYATLTLLVAYALRATTGRRIALAVALAVAYGGGIEVVQTLAPFRVFSLADMLANAVGAGLAGLVLWVETRRRASERLRDASTPE
ncbi:VanZ family protein [Halorientalis regularis]|jgi:VanZ family protein|uniref:VanZ like family protein n=1 Tax=Halorientalis regularis TaxID=660518 RepID=A0A1G7HM34_9EURY|nr:VanZ family protein [Halorientalis regularis]SDF01049.1 VanZ like family protein [Halorientalis regularis]